MNSNHQKVQVIIAGGGPAGAATALSLNARGIKCLVIEAEMYPKFKAGETIPPNALPIFRKLGIDKLLYNEKHLISYGNKLAWGSTEYAEKSFLATHHVNGWHLDRCFFEQQLKELTINEGIVWMEGTRIVDCSLKDDHWNVNVKTETGSWLMPQGNHQELQKAWDSADIEPITLSVQVFAFIPQAIIAPIIHLSRHALMVGGILHH